MRRSELQHGVELFYGDGGVTRPAGFEANGISCGIKVNGKKDLCIIYAKNPCTAAAVFTTNKIKAAPVKVSKSHISNKIQAIVCNSGNANSCTGKQGVQDAKQIVKGVSEHFEIPEKSILLASTGVIGVPLPMEAVDYGIIKIKRKLLVENNGKNAADAILSNDTRRKIAYVQLVLGGKKITIGGMAKGSGMINPNMATMLTFLTTDATISSGMMQKALRYAVKHSFNKISIDGQMSTNDSVMLLASGKQGAAAITKKNEDYKLFEYALTELCKQFAIEIVNDGEGVTKVITVTVKGAPGKSEAEQLARIIANSLPVKTAIYGQSADWGRVLQAVGTAPFPIDPEKISVTINGITACENGADSGLSLSEGRQILNKRNVDLLVDLGIGRAKDYVITTDLSYDYIKINSRYI